MQRPQSLRDEDTVQDAIEANGLRGTTIRAIMRDTRLTYNAVQKSAQALKVKGRINTVTVKRVLHLYPKL